MSEIKYENLTPIENLTLALRDLDELWKEEGDDGENAFSSLNIELIKNNVTEAMDHIEAALDLMTKEELGNIQEPEQVECLLKMENNL